MYICQVFQRKKNMYVVQEGANYVQALRTAVWFNVTRLRVWYLETRKVTYINLNFFLLLFGHRRKLGARGGGMPPKYFFNLGTVYLFSELNNGK
jgi:hypothetical protein